MTTFFVYVDFMKRNTNLWDYNAGKFFISGSGAVLGFWLGWPLDVIKSLHQADFKEAGSSNLERFRYVMRTQGFFGFYRGILPGTVSIFARNGFAMIVMQAANK